MPTIEPIWNQTNSWFRDYAQANRVASVLVERLADDRVQNECRYLIRLKWHLSAPYQEVSYGELLQNVSDNKMGLLEVLFTEIATTNYEGIDAWAERCETDYPIVEDKWLKQNRE